MPKRLPVSHKTHSDIHKKIPDSPAFTQNSLRYTSHKYRTVLPSHKTHSDIHHTNTGQSCFHTNLTPMYITQIQDSPHFTQNSLRYTSHKYRTVPTSHKTLSDIHHTNNGQSCFHTKLTTIYITQIPDSPAFTQNSLRYTSHK